MYLQRISYHMLILDVLMFYNRCQSPRSRFIHTNFVPDSSSVNQCEHYGRENNNKQTPSVS